MIVFFQSEKEYIMQYQCSKLLKVLQPPSTIDRNSTYYMASVKMNLEAEHPGVGLLRQVYWPTSTGRSLGTFFLLSQHPHPKMNVDFPR